MSLYMISQYRCVNKYPYFLHPYSLQVQHWPHQLTVYHHMTRHHSLNSYKASTINIAVTPCITFILILVSISLWIGSRICTSSTIINCNSNKMTTRVYKTNKKTTVCTLHQDEMIFLQVHSMLSLNFIVLQRSFWRF